MGIYLTPLPSLFPHCHLFSMEPCSSDVNIIEGKKSIILLPLPFVVLAHLSGHALHFSWKNEKPAHPKVGKLGVLLWDHSPKQK